MRFATRWTALVALSTASLGCGGIVVFDDDGGGDGRGTSESTSSLGPTSGSGAPADADCDGACEERAALCGQSQDACVLSCELDMSNAGRCAQAAATFFRCTSSSGWDACDVQTVDCDDERAALFACGHPGTCEPSMFCFPAPDERCEITCGGRLYRAACDSLVDDVTSVPCTCSVDDVEVGTCEQPRTGVETCCIRFFAETDAG